MYRVKKFQRPSRVLARRRVRALALADAVSEYGVEMPPCTPCAGKSLPCRLSAHSSRCEECIRRQQPHCDAVFSELQRPLLPYLLSCSLLRPSAVERVLAAEKKTKAAEKESRRTLALAVAEQSRLLAKLQSVQAEIASESSRLSRLATQRESLRVKGQTLLDRGLEDLEELEVADAPNPSENSPGLRVALPDFPASLDFLAGPGSSEGTLLTDDHCLLGSSPAPMCFLRAHTLST